MLVRPLPSLLQVRRLGLRVCAGSEDRSRRVVVLVVRAVVALGRRLDAPVASPYRLAVVAGAAHLRAPSGSRSPRSRSGPSTRRGRRTRSPTAATSCAVPDRRLRQWLQRLVTFVDPARVRRLLPGALRPRQARTRSGCPDWLQFASPVVAVLAAVVAGLGVAQRRAPLPERRGLMPHDRGRATSRRRSSCGAKTGRVRRERTAWSRRRRHPLRDRAPATMVGYIGPNGAGKSTTMKMLTGILVPERRADLGSPASTRRGSASSSARRIGVVFGQRIAALVGPAARRLVRAAAPHLPRARRSATAQNLGRVRRAARPRTTLLDTPVRQLSLGQRMRGELDGGAAARPRDPLPRRADHRARRGRPRRRVREFLRDAQRRARRRRCC